MKYNARTIFTIHSSAAGIPDRFTGRPASFSPHNYAKTTNDVSAQTLTQYPDCHILIFNVLPVLRSGVFSV